MSIVWSGVDEFVSALTQTGERASAAVRAATAEVASEMEKLAKQNASGRPGPNVVTGTLRRSITHDPITPWGLGGWQTKVGVTVIYGRRVELGFHGPDMLGRFYNQSGRPYFEPAFRATVARIPAIMAKHLGTAISG